MEFYHRPVLLDEAIKYLRIRPDGIYVDGTLGGAGHAYEIAKRLTAGGRLIGFDQDEDAVRAASARLAAYRDRVTVFHSNYCRMREALAGIGVDGVDGISACRPTSWMHRNEDLPIEKQMRRLICAWIDEEISQQRILSMSTANRNSFVSFVTTERIVSQRISLSILYRHERNSRFARQGI